MILVILRSVVFDASRTVAAVAAGYLIAVAILHLQDVVRQTYAPAPPLTMEVNEPLEAGPSLETSLPLLYFSDASQVPDLCRDGLYADLGEPIGAKRNRYVCVGSFSLVLPQ